MKIYGVVGWKNTGKTGLMERLITEISSRGFSVSSIKHAHHDADVDQPGRDSYRHREAGARETILATGKRWALMHELRGDPEPSVEELAARLSPVDLVLIEGFKRASHPRVETHRAAAGQRPKAYEDSGIRAMASDTPLEGLGIPVFHLDDAAAVADFILRDSGLPLRRG